MTNPIKNSVKDQLATALEQAKAESGVRAACIRDILKVAASETFAEVKAGSRVLGSIAKNSVSTVAANLNTAAESAVDTTIGTTIDTPASEVSTAEFASESFASEPFASELAAIEPIPHRTGQQKVRFKRLAVNVFNLVSASLSRLDARLDEQYGDRYRSAKQQVKQSAAWYDTNLEKAKSTPMEPTALEQKQNEWAAKAAAAGAVVAQKEQQLKQQIKNLVSRAF